MHLILRKKWGGGSERGRGSLREERWRTVEIGRLQSLGCTKGTQLLSKVSFNFFSGAGELWLRQINYSSPILLSLLLTAQGSVVFYM